MPRLLIVDDDESIRTTLSEALQHEGFEVDCAADGRQAIQQLDARQARGTGGFDLVLLDLMLPGIGGLDVCRHLRRSDSRTPILMVSARDTETDRVLGLELGADDYLVKPFGLRELVARCRALLRRSQQGSEKFPVGVVLQHAELTLYPDEFRVTRDGQSVNLSPKEYRLLEFFMQNPGRVWNRNQLIDQVWGTDYVVDTKTVDVHIRWLREKLEANPSVPRHLLTVRGFGYRFG
ncbi:MULTISPECIES: response regulator transcription factor [unclassified Synechococcus]|uniref:response regulator transcription factor n=1 Tax=unclassified Synechococcus TaxID=2626047 RepID=UPI0021A64E3F|nr:MULTISPECIES: response regulator transcription factor [unclassified Synechococcus]MCT0212831.1 response regulator transcription factor [Synechococcus sp. CS-1326]MCT0232875.1 response regulator transcription factor [Synechococcus sp. CS-1327]